MIGVHGMIGKWQPRKAAKEEALRRRGGSRR